MKFPTNLGVNDYDLTHARKMSWKLTIKKDGLEQQLVIMPNNAAYMEAPGQDMLVKCRWGMVRLKSDSMPAPAGLVARILWQPSQVSQAMDPKSNKGYTPSVAFKPVQNHFQALQNKVKESALYI